MEEKIREVLLELEEFGKEALHALGAERDVVRETVEQVSSFLYHLVT